MRKIILAIAFGLLMGATAADAQSIYERYPFSTFVGNPASIGSTDGRGGAARFHSPEAVAADAAGNVYVADTQNHVIRKISPDGIVSTLAGLAGSTGSADGVGSNARFNFPVGIAVDQTGTLYVADSSNQTIRKITPSGIVSTFAGLAGSAGSVDGTGSAARFRGPTGIAVDSAQNVYVGDAANNTIRKISKDGVVTTLAGLAGSLGSVDATGSAARFSFPRGVAVDRAGNVYVADANNYTIRKVTADGVVTTLAGLSGNGGTADGNGSAARFSFVTGVAIDPAGTIFANDLAANTIRRITPEGNVTTVVGVPFSAGSADERGSLARFSSPAGIASDGAGNLFVADRDNHAIRKITPDFNVTTFAGLPDSPGYADGTGFAVRFFTPMGLARDAAGNLYIADTFNDTIRKVTSNGVVSTLAGVPRVIGTADGAANVARFNTPRDVALDSAGNVFVADTGNHTIRKITPDGTVTTLAGSAGVSGSSDGLGSLARFWNPAGLAIDANDVIYVADALNNTIRKITPSGVVTTIAGKASTPGTSDGAGSTDGIGSAARFAGPVAIAVDASMNLYVADQTNDTIRKISPAATVTTLAGQARTAGSADGNGTAARFNNPQGIAVDGANNVFVSDTLNHIVRKITPLGDVTTIGGSIGKPGAIDGAGGSAQFNVPRGLKVDPAGNIYLADSYNNDIRIGEPSPVSQSLNISTRVRVQTGENVLIGGFITSGATPKRVLLRAIGPSLSNAGVRNELGDPILELHDNKGGLIVANDNWRDSQETTIQATGLAPTDDRESAIVTDLFSPGVYTVIVRGANDSTGTALVEAYDLNQTAGPVLANISTRGFVEIGDNVMIGGFILGGATGASNVLVRAIGPSLSQAGINNALADPILELHDGNGAVVATNDNWKQTQQAAIEATGIAPSNDFDAAILAALPPGNYTAIVAGKNGGTGVGLVEVYNLD